MDKFREEWAAMSEEERMQLEGEFFQEEEPVRKMRRAGEDQPMDGGAASTTPEDGDHRGRTMSLTIHTAPLPQSMVEMNIMMNELAAFGVDVSRPRVSDIYPSSAGDKSSGGIWPGQRNSV